MLKDQGITTGLALALSRQMMEKYQMYKRVYLGAFGWWSCKGRTIDAYFWG